jgi:hypothetical protein
VARNDQRALIERDLEETLEGDFGLPVELISPTTGNKQTKSANDPTADLWGQVFYETRNMRAESILDVVVHTPWVSLRRSSLDEVPTAENYAGWVVRAPMRPSRTAPKVSKRIHRPPEGGESIGFIRLYLEEIEQS